VTAGLPVTPKKEGRYASSNVETAGASMYAERQYLRSDYVRFYTYPIYYKWAG
jgi:hypothetical protein